MLVIRPTTAWENRKQTGSFFISLKITFTYISLPNARESIPSMNHYKQIFLSLAIIVFSAGKICGQPKDYYGAEIRTLESFLYGKFEVRMKSVENSGMLSSFFTFYDQPDFASNWNEIDIEILGRYNNEIQFNTITPGPNGRAAHEKRHVLNFNPHSDFHTYSFAWTPDYIAFEVDGEEVFRDTGDHIQDMNKPQKIMMNIWISHWTEWTGKWVEKKFPLEALYDYVSYYEYKPELKEKFELKWKDDFNRVNYGRWDFASHSFEGNLVQFTPSNGYINKGNLVLAITKSNNTNHNDVEESEVKSFSALDLESGYLKNNKIHLFFSNKLKRKSGKIVTNYSVEGVEIEKVVLFLDVNSEKQEVILHLPKDFKEGAPLTVKVKDLEDVHGQTLENGELVINEVK